MASAPRVVLAVALVLAAALGVALFLHSPDGEPLDRVPADVDHVGHLDAETMRSDPATANATRRSFRFQSAVDFYAGPEFTGSYAFREDGPGGEVRSVTYFGRSNGSYAARIVSADWRRTAVPPAVERSENVSLDRTTYRGRPLHAGDGYAVAALGNDTFVIGNETAVRDALDVAAGERESVSGPLRERYRATTGFARFAYRFQPGSVPDVPFAGESIRSIEYVATGYRQNGSALAVAVNVTTGDESSARSVRGIVNAGLTFYRFETSNDSLRAELDRIELSRTGRTVRITYESAPENYRVLLRGLARNQPREG